VEVAPLFPTASTADARPPAARPFSGRVLFMGRLTNLKGWHHLVEAVPAAAERLGRPLTLVVAGDGPDRAAFEAACARRGVPCEFRGWLTGTPLADELRTADLLAVPSLWPEPFGLVGLDAARVGLPVVAYAVGGIPEWLVPGWSGELAPGRPPQPAALADAMVRALDRPDHWQRLRAGAWETARSFTVEAHVARLLPILVDAARSDSTGGGLGVGIEAALHDAPPGEPREHARPSRTTHGSRLVGMRDEPRNPIA